MVSTLERSDKEVDNLGNMDTELQMKVFGQKEMKLMIGLLAKAETVQKVSDIVKEQLALSADTPLTAESKFSALGADSLDTVEIVMALEEKFNISVEESDAQNITTIQEAADLIEDLVQKKPTA
ncbi:unnamed protein product [Arabis nemorensis]|uniref:Acyl carrier protein n=1 Tax=Arabis nemorensis TaxID=586526 RepID=A0A565BNI6_9BRAS|nr:unnamed protein product [Arabis nemorensis]